MFDPITLGIFGTLFLVGLERFWNWRNRERAEVQRQNRINYIIALIVIFSVGIFASICLIWYLETEPEQTIYVHVLKYFWLYQNTKPTAVWTLRILYAVLACLIVIVMSLTIVLLYLLCCDARRNEEQEVSFWMRFFNFFEAHFKAGNNHEKKP